MFWLFTFTYLHITELPPRFQGEKRKKTNNPRKNNVLASCMKIPPPDQTELSVSMANSLHMTEFFNLSSSK